MKHSMNRRVLLGGAVATEIPRGDGELARLSACPVTPMPPRSPSPRLPVPRCTRLRGFGKTPTPGCPPSRGSAITARRVGASMFRWHGAAATPWAARFWTGSARGHRRRSHPWRRPWA